MKIISTLALVVSLGLAATGAENSPLWLRYPAISPDGRTLLFEFKGDIWSMATEGGNAVRLTLRVVRICTRQLYNVASKQSRTVLPGDLNYSYSDGDQYYSWSAGSKWLLVQFAPAERMVAPEVGIVAADGASPVRNLTQSGYEDATPKWALDGKMMIWATTRDGALSQGGGALSGDFYGMYFTKAASDRKMRLTVNTSAASTLRFGIPMGCWRTLDGKCGENNQTEPDVRVANEPEVMTGGRDQQLEAAVRQLMTKRAEMASRDAPP